MSANPLYIAKAPAYTDEDLQVWQQRINEKSWKRVMVFFKHETEGPGPVLAERFQEMLGG